MVWKQHPYFEKPKVIYIKTVVRSQQQLLCQTKKKLSVMFLFWFQRKLKNKL